MDACMEDRFTTFESSSPFPADSTDSVQAESFCPALDSPTCSTAQLRHPPTSEDAVKLEPGQQNLQIDCRASQQMYYTTPIKQDHHGTVQTGGGPCQDHEMAGELPQQEPASSYESAGVPEYQLSPSVRPVSADKGRSAFASKYTLTPTRQEADKLKVQKCSQCGATKTPMWRNDTQGNKTLCNACGVRLQRQLNKQKQQAQPVTPQPTTLIAGKLPRCRTSPAKLSRQELLNDVGHENLQGGEVLKSGARGRSLTLVHGQGGQPHLTIAQNPPKRKGAEGASRAAAPREERKRTCSERGSLDGGGPSHPNPDIVGPITLMAPDKMADNCFAKLHLPASTSHGGTGGMLMVYNEGCAAIAKCTQPGPEGAMRYSLEQQAWVWDGHAHCSMLLHTQETRQQFEDLLSKWRHFRQMGFNQSIPVGHMGGSLPHLDPGFSPGFPQGQHPGGGMPPGAQAEFEDLRFLDHINLKIRGESGGAAPQAGSVNPKALIAPLGEEVFVRLLGAFEFFLQRPQGFTESNVCQLSANLDWTPNRAVILAVHRYWLGKLIRQGRKEEYQKATKGGGHPHPASIPRSFSASPPVPSGRSDISAMTLEDFALSQQRAASEETSDNTQLQSAFATEGANLPSFDYPTPMNYGLAPMVQDQAGMGSFMPGRQPWVLPPCFPPEMAPYPSQQEEDWEVDPLDPSTLARIADPNQRCSFESRKSGTLTGGPMEERCLQSQGRCMSLQELGSASRGGGGVLRGTPLPQDGQQMFSFVDAPALLQSSPRESPTVPQAGMTGAGRHSGVDLSSLRQQLYSGSLAEHTQGETHQDMTSNQNDNPAFLYGSGDDMKT